MSEPIEKELLERIEELEKKVEELDELLTAAREAVARLIIAITAAPR